MDNPKGYFYMGGRKVRASEAAKDPSLLGFDVSEKEKGKTAGQMYEKALRPLLDLLEKKTVRPLGMRSPKNTTNIPHANFLKLTAGRKA